MDTVKQVKRFSDYRSRRKNKLVVKNEEEFQQNFNRICLLLFSDCLMAAVTSNVGIMGDYCAGVFLHC